MANAKVPEDVRQEADAIMAELEAKQRDTFAPSWAWSGRIKRDRQKAAIALLIQDGKMVEMQAGIYKLQPKQEEPPKKKRGRPKKKPDDN